MTSSNKPIPPMRRYARDLLEHLEHDPELAAIVPDEALLARLDGDSQGLIETIELILTHYADRNALASRDYEIKPNSAGAQTRHYLPRFKYVTYKELLSRIKSVASAWQHDSVHGVKPEEMVCIMGFTGVDFAVLDFACQFTHAVTVPLQSATAGGDLTEIFANVQPATLAATINDLELCAEHAVTNKNIRSLVAFDYDPLDDSERSKFENAERILRAGKVATQLISMQDLTALGDPEKYRSPEQDRPAGEKADGQRLAAILHSSGSTGKPKGAMMIEDSLKSYWVISKLGPLPVIGMGFSPLNHILGRGAMASALLVGGLFHFTLEPDMSTLFEDIQIARPTFMIFFPRVLELIYQHYLNEVARRVRADEDADEELIADQVREEMSRSYLGDRFKGGMVGGAPTSPAVLDFIFDCFGVAISNGYGNTESGSGSVVIDGRVQRPLVIDYKLRDVPELGYYTTDKPYPRGEFCFKSRVGVTEYYKQPEATAGLFDDEGFSLTGDVVEERGPDKVFVIDRVKDVLKLSQGEYVAVGLLGTKFEAGSAVIKQIYVYGNSLRAHLLAVVVPERTVVEATLGADFDEAQLKNLIRSEMQKVASEEGLKSFEVPRDFIVEWEEFSQANGLLSSVRKRLRPALKEKYAARLEAIYEAQEQAQDEELQALKDPDSDLSTLQKLTRLLEINLKISGLDPDDRQTFAALGGDSMSSVLFSLEIEEIFGVTLAPDALLSPTGNLQKWAALIDEALSGDGLRPTFESVHGKGVDEIHAEQLLLEKFIEPAVLSAAADLPDINASSNANSNTVLLTGGNGFLGHIVCMEWLEKLAASNGKLICLIRGSDDAAARQRLDAAFVGVDPELEQRYFALAKDYLEVIAGDAGEAQLGLSDETYQRLAADVDRISHVAALVNHRLSYEHLFGPNVVGTAEIIKLALTTRKKSIDFVSTEAVVGLRLTVGLNEAAPLSQSAKLADFYALGYGTSKWAGEHLLQQAQQQFGIPVNTFRGDMMLSHRRYKGQINDSDMFTRLLFSIVATGLAPYSFYKRNSDGTKAQGHYDGTPVDVVAAAVCGVMDNTSEYRTFSVANHHHDDGCSLDAFVDWIESAGYTINRIDDHQDWLDRITDKLNSLPEQQRKQSALEILSAFAKPLPVSRPAADNSNYQALVKSLSVGPDVPHLDEPYIHKCLQDLQAIGLLASA